MVVFPKRGIMPFIGTPTITQITDRLVRISDISMAASSGATIGLFQSVNSPDAVLPEAFAPKSYTYAGVELALKDMVTVQGYFLSQLGGPSGPLAIQKIGNTPESFLIEIATPAYDDEEAEPGLEFYIRYHE
jgi:hypothetical protein